MAMGFQKWPQNTKLSFKKLFHILTVNLLSLSLPISFLLFCRFVRSQYLQVFLPLSTPPPSSFLASFLLSANRVFLLTLVSLGAIATLLHTLLGKSIILGNSSDPISQLRLSTAWVILCASQVGVALGIEEGTTLAVDTSSFGLKRSLWCRLLFFLGLHAAMLHWSKAVVKPVVDDTIFGAPVEEKGWGERVAMAVSFGGLWWWRLRDEADSPAIVTESKMELLMGPTAADFAGWALYYLIVAIGFVRILRSIAWFCKRKEEDSSQFCQSKRIEIV